MTRRTLNPKMTSFLKPRITLSAAPMVSLFPKDSATTQVSIMTTPRITLSSAPTASFLKMKGWSPMNAKVASVVMVPVLNPAPTVSFLKKKGWSPIHAKVSSVVVVPVFTAPMVSSFPKPRIATLSLAP